MPDYSNWLTPGASTPAGQNPFQPYGPTGPGYNWYDTHAQSSPANDYWFQGPLDPNMAINRATDLTGARNRGAFTTGGTGSSGAMPTIDPRTGLYVVGNSPFTGTDPQGNTYAGGRQTGVPVPFQPGASINPNDPNQRYRAANIVKSPEIASATSGLLDTFTKTASSALQDFGSYLNEFKKQIGGAASKAAAATDIGPLSATLRGQQGAYASALDKAAADYAALNKQTAATEQGIVGQAQGLLPQYDTAINNAEALQQAQMQAAVKAATGRNLGGSELAELAKGSAAISVPLEQAKINQKYNILSGYALPVAQDIAGRETARIAQFDPQIAAQKFQSGQATEKDIQNLAMATAQMSYTDALAYMNSLSVPAEIQQRILAGQVSTLGGLNQLYGGSRYQGLQDVLGTNVTPQYSTTFTPGRYPGAPQYSPSTWSGSTGGPNYAAAGGGNTPPYNPLLPGPGAPYNPLLGVGAGYGSPDYAQPGMSVDYSNMPGYEQVA